MTSPTSDRHLHPVSGAPVSAAGGGNDGGDIRERLARIETQMKFMATREDVAEVKNLIAEKEATTLKWLTRLVTVASISLLTAVIGLLAALIRTSS